MKVRELVERLEAMDIVQEDEIKVFTPATGFSDPMVEIVPSENMVVIRQFGVRL